MINSKIKEFLEGIHGIIMGTRDAVLKPDYCRVLGFEQMDDRHLRFFIDKDSNTSTMENLADNGMIALVMAKPNFECYQFKGRCVSVTKAIEADDQSVSAYLKDLNEVVLQMGVKDGSVYNFPHANICTILMDVQEIFDQTPRMGTGNKI